MEQGQCKKQPSAVSVEKSIVICDNKDAFQYSSIRERPLNDNGCKETLVGNRDKVKQANKSAETVPVPDAQHQSILGSIPLPQEKGVPAKDILYLSVKPMEQIAGDSHEKMADSTVKNVLEIKQQHGDTENKKSNCKRSQVTALGDPPSSKQPKPSTDKKHETSQAVEDKKGSPGQTDNDNGTRSMVCSTSPNTTISFKLFSKPFKNPSRHWYQVQPMGQRHFIPWHTPSQVEQMQHFNKRGICQQSAKAADTINHEDHECPRVSSPTRSQRPPLARKQRHGTPTTATRIRPDQIRPAYTSPILGYQENVHPIRPSDLYGDVFGDTGFHFPEVADFSRDRKTEDHRSGEHTKVKDDKNTIWSLLRLSPVNCTNDAACDEIPGETFDQQEVDTKPWSTDINQGEESWTGVPVIDTATRSILGTNQGEETWSIVRLMDLATGPLPSRHMAWKTTAPAARTVAVAPQVGIAARSVSTTATPLLYTAPRRQCEIPPEITHHVCEISPLPSIEISNISGSRHELWQRSSNACAEPDISQIHYRFDCFDSAAILTHPKLYKNLATVVKRSRAAGVQRIITLGFNLDTSEKNLATARTYPELICAAVGIHPHVAHSWTDRTLEILERLVSNSSSPVIAIGECGLDYHHSYSTHDIQMEVFDRQVGLACSLQKSLIVHERKAHSDILKILDNYGGTLPAVVIHCFSGGLAEARAYISRGYYIGITGSIVRHQKTNHRYCVLCLGELPLEKILIESTAPYMFSFCRAAVNDMQVALTPETRDLIHSVGDQNEPCTLPVVVEQVAACLRLKPEHVAKITMENAKTFYQL